MDFENLVNIDNMDVENLQEKEDLTVTDFEEEIRQKELELLEEAKKEAEKRRGKHGVITDGVIQNKGKPGFKVETHVKKARPVITTSAIEDNEGKQRNTKIKTRLQ
jgi:hypothetical protein